MEPFESWTLIVFWYSGHGLNNGLKVSYSDANFPNHDLNNLDIFLTQMVPTILNRLSVCYSDHVLNYK